jgi:predicted PurR-regulated permease PerM
MAFVIALIGFIDGKVGAGVTMCVIGLISGVADNIIRPFLSSLGEVEVPAFIGFLAVIGGVIVLGLPGLFIGPLIASLVFGVLPLIFDEYFPNSEREENDQNPS